MECDSEDEVIEWDSDIEEAEICSICQDVMNNGQYTVPECEHKFHIDCIIAWFRSGHERAHSCPICRLKSSSSQYHENNDDIFSVINSVKRISRDKNAPLELKNAYKEYREIENQWKSSVKRSNDALKVMKQTPEYKEYTKIRKNSLYVRNKLNNSLQNLLFINTKLLFIPYKKAL